MFESGGSADDIRTQADKAVSALLADLSLSRVEENKWSAMRVHTAYDILDARLGGEASLDEIDPGLGCIARGTRAAENETMVAMDVSKSVAVTMIDVGEALFHRLPLIDADFTAGLLDYPRVRTIVSVLSRARTDTVMAIEAEVLAAAHRCTPHSLRTAIWAAWFDHDPDEAQAARAKADAESARVYTRRTDDGGAELIARLSACTIAEADLVLDQLVGTVCDQDPRTPQELRCAAHTAVFRRQIAIECGCGRGADCPVFDADLSQGSPAVVLNVYADLPTVLGLLADRPHLADGTPLDEEMAKWVLTNARIRGLLVELLDLARQEFPERFDANCNPAPAEAHRSDASEGGDGHTEHADATDVVAQSRTGAESDEVADAADEVADAADEVADSAGRGASEPTSCIPDHASRIRPRTKVRTARRRTKIRPALDTPPPSPAATLHRRPRLSHRERDVAAQVRQFLAAIDADPTVAAGIDPTGHGGYLVAPRGAWTYRPSAELAACVRATYPTCVFAGCAVPAEQCELDHTVPFDQADPAAGGWTVFGNLAPLCKNHHQAKTERSWTLSMLEHGFLCWTTRSGLIRITAPQTWNGWALPIVDKKRPKREKWWDRPVQPLPDPPLPDDLFAPTWWEIEWTERYWEPIPDISYEGIARRTDPEDRQALHFYRRKKQEHDRILRARARAEAELCPF